MTTTTTKSTIIGTVSTATVIPFSISRVMSCQAIADDITSRISGKLIGWGDLFDPQTGKFLSESELTAKGAVFMTVNYSKVLGKNDTTVKGRISGLPTPYIRKVSSFQMIVNVDWQSYINRRSEHGKFVADSERKNGVVNYENCRAVGTTKEGFYTLNGVAFKVLDGSKYYDENGNEYTDVKTLTAEYLKVQSDESKKREADKHGIDVLFDPKYRTVRLDSCANIKCFGFQYIPTV